MIANRVSVPTSVESVTDNVTSIKRITITAEFEQLFRHEVTKPNQEAFAAVMQALLRGRWKVQRMDFANGYEFWQKDLDDHTVQVTVRGSHESFVLDSICDIPYFAPLKAILRDVTLNELSWRRFALWVPRFLYWCCVAVFANAAAFYVSEETSLWWSVLALALVGLIALNLQKRRAKVVWYKKEIAKARRVIEACA